MAVEVSEFRLAILSPRQSIMTICSHLFDLRNQAGNDGAKSLVATEVLMEKS